jgi:uncharacterized protein (TIRG00374 family)
MNNSPKEKQLPWPKILFGLFILFFAVVIFSDMAKVEAAFSRANWWYIASAIILTAASYYLAAYSYYLANFIFGLEIDKKKLIKIGFVTIAFNNLITLGGTIGYSLRVMMLKNEKNKTRHIMAASIFFSYLNFLIIVVFSAISLAYTLAGSKISSGIAMAFEAAFLIFILFSILLTLIMFNEKFRRTSLGFLSGIIKLVSKKDMSENLQNTGLALSEGVIMTKKMPGYAVFLILTTLADWVTCLFILWFCFRAFDITLSPIFIISGFFLSVVAGMISMIPGGLGVQDLSEAGIYSILGVPFAGAIAVSVVFRVIYYFIPFLGGLVIYHRLISEKNRNK